jgi:hypothetical protein
LRSYKLRRAGLRTHITEKTFETKSGKRQFTKLFLNEVGNSRIYVDFEGQELILGNLKISSPKLTYDNYSLITEYLLFKGYFDSHFLYKVTLDTQQSDLHNSLLEALRKLLELLKFWRINLFKFKKYPINLLSSESSIQDYDDNKNITNESISWLIENADSLIPTTKSRAEIELNSKHFQIEKILTTEYLYICDSYENRVIHGFISNLLKGVIDKESIFLKTVHPRTRISDFRDFLIICFNNLLQKKFVEVKNEISSIQSFFIEELPVVSPIYEFPKKVDGFHSKKHYQEVLKLITFSKKIFALDFGAKKLSLEIESFDKLFEVYCFYLISDIIMENFSVKEFKKTNFSADTTNNKLAGQYSTEYTSNGIRFDLYYECKPTDIIQFSDSGKFNYNPDFILSITHKELTYYIIFDAKYKNYNTKYLKTDLESLTLKYLHKIGVKNDTKNLVIGLFPISLGVQSKPHSIFTREFNFLSRKPRIPQIGNIELDPKSIIPQKNSLLEIINFGVQTITQKSHL